MESAVSTYTINPFIVINRTILRGNACSAVWVESFVKCA
jgi:hypothetical protein